jgi:hypothetical protein
MSRQSCSNFDAAVPGTGPIRSLVPTQSVEFEKYNSSYNYSLKSRSDYNLNPQPEGNVFSAYPKAEQNREGVYVIDTDRGELSPTTYTQVNTAGQKQFQNRLQDTVRPTMKETTLYSYDGYIAPVTSKQALYSQFIPQYAKIGGKEVRVGGASNYGLRTATEYSYFATPGPTSINGQGLQNPDARLGYTWQRPDENVDGAGTFKGVIPDGSRTQNYRPLPKPTSNGLRFNYNLETNGGSVADYSQLLGKQVDGIENRYTASYQIAPLFNNPLTVIWNPDNKGEIPAFYNDPDPIDYSYETFQNLPQNEFVSGGYNGDWAADPNSTSANAYVLDLEKGVHNPRLEWAQGVNTLPGVIYSPDDSVKIKVPTTAYGGPTDVYQQYLINQTERRPNNTYTTLGDPSAGFTGMSVNDFVKSMA